MALRNWNLDWLAHNAVRNYPLAAECTATDTTGAFTIPPDFLVGLDLPISAAIDVVPDRFFIRQLGAYSTGYTLVVAYDNGTEIVDVATAMIPQVTGVRNKTYTLGGIDPYDDTVGKLTIGKLDAILQQPAGMWTFTLTTARLEPDCIRPMLRGITGLLTRNGSVQSERLTGDIELVPGRNIQFTIDGNTIRIDAIEGAGLTETCVCTGDDASPCIKQINDAKPTADGILYLVSGSDCTEITSSGNRIKITDVCAQPCCGCQELEAITRDLERFNTERPILQRFLTDLQTAVNGMSLTVLGSKLGDRGCSPCA